MVKLRMHKGVDEVNHGGTRYVVSNVDQTIDVPPEVAHVLLRTSAGAVLAEPEPPEENMTLVRARHITNSCTGISWRNRQFAPDEHGYFRIPVIAVADLAPHGIVMVPDHEVYRDETYDPQSL